MKLCPSVRRRAARALDMVSRLKGIETSPVLRLPVAAMTTLDMLSRLKGIETQSLHQCEIVYPPLDMLSRLKGIETTVISTVPGVSAI